MPRSLMNVPSGYASHQHHGAAHQWTGHALIDRNSLVAIALSSRNSHHDGPTDRNSQHAVALA